MASQNLTDPSDTLLSRWRGQRETPPDIDGWNLLALTIDGAEVGIVGFGHREGDTSATLAELWIDPDHRRRGHGRRALRATEDHCRRRGAAQLLTTTTPDAARQRLFADWDVTSRYLELRVGDAPVLPPDVTASPMTGDALDAWHRHNIREYAASLTRTGVTPPDDALAQAEQQIAQLLPQGTDTPDHEFWALNNAQNRVASLWVHIDRLQGFGFIYKTESDPASRGKGYGRAATRLAETRALAAGLDRVRLHVFADNAPANSLYAALGYRPIQENLRRQLPDQPTPSS